MTPDPKYAVIITYEEEAGTEAQAKTKMIGTTSAAKDQTKAGEDGQIQSPSIRINAFLPEQIGFNIESEYDAPFAEGLAGLIVGDVGRVIAQAVFGKFTTQAMSFQFWKGSSPIQLTIPLEFVADNIVKVDVRDQIAALMKLTLPSATGINTDTNSDIGDYYRTLIPPGPKLSLNEEKLAGAGINIDKATFAQAKAEAYKGNLGRALSLVGVGLQNTAEATDQSKTDPTVGFTNPFSFLKFTNKILV